MAPIYSTPYLLLVLLSVTSLLRSGLAANAKAASGSGRSRVWARNGAAESSSTAEAANRAWRSRVCPSGYANYSKCMRRAYQLKLDALAALDEFDVERALALVHDSRALVADQCAQHEHTVLTCCPSLAAKNAQPTAVGEATPAPSQRTPKRPAGGKLRRSSTQSMCDVARNDMQNMVSQMGRLSLQIDDATNRVFAKLAELDSEKEEAS